MLIIGGLVAAAGLAVGGYFLNDHLQCRGLEEDYLNSVSSIRSAGLMKGLGSSETDAAVTALQESEWKRLEQTLAQIYDQCGRRAGATATRKGSDLLLGR